VCKQVLNCLITCLHTSFLSVNCVLDHPVHTRRSETYCGPLRNSASEEVKVEQELARQGPGTTPTRSYLSYYERCYRLFLRLCTLEGVLELPRPLGTALSASHFHRWGCAAISSHWNPAYISHSSHACYTFHPSCRPWLYDRNNPSHELQEWHIFSTYL
jgi:hypothetical protein